MFIDPEIRDEVLSDARRFFANGFWYTGMGIPHRRGYLLDGPPGTGKSSLILALASELNKPLYIINAQTLSDDSLAEAFQRAQSGIVVLEDIDTVTITKARQESPEGDDKVAPIASLSLSGLLNAIDGLYASEGRLLFMTSNKPQSLDPALVRPGRIDRQFHIGYLTEHLASMMTAKFLPPASDFFERVVLPLMRTTPLSGATLQNMLLKELHRLEFPDEADQQVEPPGAIGPSPVGGQLQPGDGGYFGDWFTSAAENSNSTGRI
jgi:ATP-dependent Zn protease